MELDLLYQSQIQDFVECAFRFHLRNIARVENPTIVVDPADQYELAVERGQLLHRMVEQYLSGVPRDVLEGSAVDAQTRLRWVRIVDQALKDLPERRFPEITLVAPLAGVRLAAKVDLLAIEPGRVVLVDWKTSVKVPIQALEERIQSKVYRWVVSRSVEQEFGIRVSPEQIRMRYWFADDPSPSVDISYSQSKQSKDEHDLVELISRIRSESAFARTTHIERCKYCRYRGLCHPMLTPTSAPLGVDIPFEPDERPVMDEI